MINKVIDGICIALGAEFGDGYEIYTESVEQGLKEPCFSVFCINPTSNLFLGKRYFRQNQFCVQFFPSEVEQNAQCNDVMERLFHCLEYIIVDGDKIRGVKMSNEVSDGVLSFFLNYNMFMYKVEEKNPMEGLSIEANAKKG